jgi:2-oxoglutarate ferredoxin oxidoreductase subunit beta
VNKPLTIKDFETTQQVRWCPGCGDYAILKSVQRSLAECGATPESTVFVSGIGCSSRFPYYVNAYGFHTIHGRAPAVATGLKLANPALDVWVITGDGDGLSIGGNHLLHTLRRNVGLKILLFNNEIYGLTKGQYSPTSRAGTRSPTTPQGSTDTPLSAGLFALGAGGRFIARAIDTDKNGLGEVLNQAHDYNGAAFVEIFQNCNVYNDQVFASFTDRSTAAERQIHVRHGEPLVFGKDGSLGLRFDPQTMGLEVIESTGQETQVLVHDQTSPFIAQLLLAMDTPEFPVALGVIHRRDEESFEQQFHASHPTGLTRTARVQDVMHGKNTWQVD